MGSLSLLQRIFLTQELNLGLWPCRQILFQLSYRGSSIYLCLSVFKMICLKKIEINHDICMLTWLPDSVPTNKVLLDHGLYWFVHILSVCFCTGRAELCPHLRSLLVWSLELEDLLLEFLIQLKSLAPPTYFHAPVCFYIYCFQLNKAVTSNFCPIFTIFMVHQALPLLFGSMSDLTVFLFCAGSLKSQHGDSHIGVIKHLFVYE